MTGYRSSLYGSAWRSTGSGLRVLVLLVAACVALPLSGEENTDWILIDTGAMELSVMRGDVARHTYSNISIGRNGVTTGKKQRDGKTPLGEFHIVRTTTDTPFHRFFALDYPNLQHAESARQTGTIDRSEYFAIRRAARSGQMPPQNTVLGGYIGIHGIGQGDTAIHEDFNWTNGCVALTNAQIDDLSRRVYIGMKVVIRR